MLEHLTEIFSTREIAIAFWLSVSVGWVVSRPDLRKHVPSLFKYAFARQLSVVYLAALAYVGTVVLCLSGIGIWHLGHLKSTILWCLFAALLSIFRVEQIAEGATYFKQVIVDNLKLVVVLEFIISTYTFAWWVEILIFPILTFITLLAEFARGKKQHELVYSVFRGLMTAIGFLLLGIALYELVGDFENFATAETLSDFTLPPILTLSFLPFLYCLAIFSTYERIFATLGILISNKALLRYAKRMAMIRFRNKLELLQRWRRDVAGSKPKSESDIDNLIEAVVCRHQRELSPVDIQLDQGWCPYRSKEFLADNGLSCGEYHPLTASDPDWYANSNTVKIDGEVLANNIAYYVDGDEEAAKQLKLVLNVNHIEQQEAAKRMLCDLAEALCSKALSQPLPSAIEGAILNHRDLATEIKGKPLSVEHRPFENAVKGYTSYVLIGHYRPTYMGA